MKNCLIAILLIIIIVLSSFLYKNSKTSFVSGFPIVKETKGAKVDAPLYLYVFFSRRNCIDCLQFIRELNNLPPQFIVTGIVPENELKNQDELRNVTGAAFPLVGEKNFRKFIPASTPTIIGVSPQGEIVLVLPGAPGLKTYLEYYLSSLYNKLYPMFMESMTNKNLEYRKR